MGDVRFLGRFRVVAVVNLVVLIKVVLPRFLPSVGKEENRGEAGSMLSCLPSSRCAVLCGIVLRASQEVSRVSCVMMSLCNVFMVRIGGCRN